MIVARLVAVDFRTKATRSFNVDGATYNPFDGIIQEWPLGRMDTSLHMIAKIVAVCSDAAFVVSRMKQVGIQLHIVCYNILIGRFCRRNRLDKAYELLKDVEQAEVKPDSVTYNTLISFFSEYGDFETAHKVIKRMVTDGFVLTVITHGALIHAYCLAGNPDEATNVANAFIDETNRWIINNVGAVNQGNEFEFVPIHLQVEGKEQNEMQGNLSQSKGVTVTNESNVDEIKAVVIATEIHTFEKVVHFVEAISKLGAAYHMRFYVDSIPIRVLKNNENIWESYPSQPMQVEVNLWDGDSWATDGGRTKANWSYAPFKAHFQGFNIGGCPCNDESTINPNCYSPMYWWWNAHKFWKLDGKQQREYEDVRANYMTCDYCSDKPKHSIPPPECFSNS